MGSEPEDSTKTNGELFDVSWYLKNKIEIYFVIYYSLVKYKNIEPTLTMQTMCYFWEFL